MLSYRVIVVMKSALPWSGIRRDDVLYGHSKNLVAHLSVDRVCWHLTAGNARSLPSALAATALEVQWAKIRGPRAGKIVTEPHDSKRGKHLEPRQPASTLQGWMPHRQSKTRRRQRWTEHLSQPMSCETSMLCYNAVQSSENSPASLS